MQPKGFERALGVGELLSGIARETLAAELGRALGRPISVTTPSGETLLGEPAEPGETVRRVPLRYDLEVVGYLQASACDEGRLRALGGILELFFLASARYFLASELHQEVVQADFHELAHKHQLLAHSEARYKALAAELEARVQEQVGLIEHTQRQLYQAEKMASVGQLAAGVAHEINNPLGFIRSNLNTARSYVETLETFGRTLKTQGVPQASAWVEADLDFVLDDFRALLAESLAGAERVARIVADLKGFSAVDQAGEASVDLNEQLRSVGDIAATQFRGRAELVLDLGPLPAVRCQPGQLNQVFLNLMLNAIQAMEGRGQIRIATDVRDHQIRVRIADTGRGIPEDILPRIFEPFFTTREVGQGTGLGLTVSRDIVVAHGGRIEVESRVGAGTTFTVWLPIGPD
ncbi:MAG: ATP-binding protein [Betaproteobacteria bacterium]|nr:ATP-binding protein [Betaproteobacteria bacterium]